MRIGPGLRATISKTGVGLSAGGRGARYSVHSSGRTWRSVGVPGTGASLVSVSGGGRRRKGARSRQLDPLVAANVSAVLPRPGLFASKAERRYHAGVHAYLRGEHEAALEAMEECVTLRPDALSARLISAICAGKLDRPDSEQIRHLEAIVASDAPMPDRLQSRFLPPHMAQLTMQGRITEHIWAEVPFDSAGAALLLAEHYQEAGRIDEAIGLVQQLHVENTGDLAIRLSLADLLLADGDHTGVVEVAAGVENEHDLGAALLHMRAAALHALGHQTGAFEAFKQALAKPSRDPDLLKVIRYDRALAYEHSGQRARARQDLERIFAVDPSYLDVKQRLEGG